MLCFTTNKFESLIQANSSETFGPYWGAHRCLPLGSDGLGYSGLFLSAVFLLPHDSVSASSPWCLIRLELVLPLFYFSHPFGKVLSKQGPCSPNAEKSCGHRRREHMEPKVKKHLSANIWTAVSGLCLSAMTAWSFDKLSWSLIISSERHAELFGKHMFL